MAEAIHAYDRDGVPHNEVAYADKNRKGEKRRTTLRDLKKNDWLPSSTKIIGQIVPPGLINYFKSSEREACARNISVVQAFIDGELDAKAFHYQIGQEAAEHASKAAEGGKRIHAAVDRALRGADFDHTYELVVLNVLNFLREIAPINEWTAEKSFAYTADEYAFGGQADLVCMSRRVCLDLKTQDFTDPKGAREYKDTWTQQLASYAAGVGLVEQPWRRSQWEGVRTGELVLSRHPEAIEQGLMVHCPWTEAESHMGWRQFDLLRRHWWLTTWPERLEQAEKGVQAA